MRQLKWKSWISFNAQDYFFDRDNVDNVREDRQTEHEEDDSGEVITKIVEILYNKILDKKN